MTMANSDDRSLLQAYARKGDAQAFAQLVRRYAGLVYSAARRITGNAADAEDVSQHTFFQLASWAGKVRGSPAAWLHATATRKAVSIIRSESARRQREQARLTPAASPDWSEVEPLVDRAISELPDELRECVLLHYLQGVPQAELAERLGVDQSTVSRRIGKALEELRDQLAAAGVAAPAAPAVTVLLASTEAPATLLQSLLKIGLMPAPASSAAATATSVGTMAKVMAVAAAAIVVGLAVGIFAANRGTSMSTQSTAVAATRPAVSFRGSTFKQDSFTLAMQALARQMGKEISYDELLALSGNAFAPAFRPEEPERSFWAIQGGGRNIDLVCRRLGLTCRPFPRGDNLGQTIPPKPTDPDAAKAWGFDNFRRPLIAAIREAMSRGELILSMGEFFNENGVLWTEWGIVTEARDDGTILGAASNGRLDNRIDFIRDGWFIGVDPAGPQMTAEQAQREVLRRAAMRIRGDVIVKTETYGRNIVFGAPAVDAWMAAMDQADFCTHCKDDVPCARDIALPVYGEAQAAQRWLAQTGIPAAREAAGHYRRIAQLLEPYALDDGMVVSPTEAIQLNGVTYPVESLMPGQQLADLPRGEAVGPYADHLMPYYNIHCELADEPNQALDARLRKLGISYEQYWQRLPIEKLATKPMALLATSRGKLVGYIRFYPADHARLRNLKERQDVSADTLLIGGCAFTVDALNAGLDRALLKRVIVEAKRDGYRRIQAVAWPDARAFAMWGEGMQRQVYEDEGFKSLAIEPADAVAFTDICSGAHGEEVRKLAREDVPPNIALGPLGELHLVQLDLAEQSVSGYRAVIGDVAKQQEHARKVLLPVKQELLAAADALERATRTGMEDQMTQATNQTVRIERVPKLDWKKDTQSCFIGSLAAALSVTDHPISARELSGLTALAFRTRWLYYTDKPKWCPSCPVGETPEEIAAVGRNIGWQLDSTMGADNEKITPSRLADIVASLDRGMPVVVYDTRWNPAVAYGYTDAGRKLIVTDYFGGDGPTEVNSMPPFVLIIQKFAGAPERKAAVIDALKMAVTNWKTDHKVNGAADYWYGRAAYDHWITDCLEAKQTPEGNCCFASWWNMDVLCEARQQAGSWLADIAPLFEEPAAGHLRAASGIYMQEHKMLWQAWGVEDAFNGDAGKWKNMAYRQRIADVLTQARDMEAKAMAAIEWALAN